MSITGKYFGVKVTANEVTVSIATVVGKGGKRGKVSGFSRNSQSRLRSLLNSIVFDTVDFVTLTYRYNIQDAKRAYADLKEFARRVRAQYGRVGIVWRAELQKRGAIHYHVFVFDAPKVLDLCSYCEIWLDVTKQVGDTAARKYGVNVTKFDRLGASDIGVIVTYLVKYAAKDGGAPGGRQWGVFGKGDLNIVENTRRVSPTGTAAVAAALIEAGGVVMPVTAGGQCVRYYFGNIGADNTDRFKQIVGAALSELPADIDGEV